jgi:hypothetical protein
MKSPNRKDGFVLVTGAPRSGTTFVAMLMNRHPRILIAPESRIFGLREYLRRPFSFGSTTFSSGLSSSRAALAALAAIADTLREAPDRLFDKLRIEYHQEGATIRSVVAECEIFGEKDPTIASNKHRFFAVLKDFPIGKIVFITRSITDVVHSMVARGVVNLPVQAVESWLASHENLMQAVASGALVHMVRYENLSGPFPDREVRDLISFLGLPEPNEELIGRMIAVPPVSNPTRERLNFETGISCLASRIDAINTFIENTRALT